MSEDNLYEGAFGDANEDDEGSFDDEAGLVAYMDQQSAEFNAMEHEFADRYGFVHKCRCDQDYTEGNMVEVTECYARMTTDALEACATLHAENKLLRGLIKNAIGVALVESNEDTAESSPEGTETD